MVNVQTGKRTADVNRRSFVIYSIDSVSTDIKSMTPKCCACCVKPAGVGVLSFSEHAYASAVADVEGVMCFSDRGRSKAGGDKPKWADKSLDRKSVV